LTNREFSFTLRDDQGSEIYIRFQSFANRQLLKQEILKKCPEKIDLGAIYSAPPAQKAQMRPGLFKPVSRELVFDIDMTDYDDIRTCCQGANVCNKCWKYMTVALKILNSALTGTFSISNTF
jgi:DNA primase small subunit